MDIIDKIRLTISFLLINTSCAYAKTVTENTIRLDIGILLGIVMLGIVTTLGGWLLDIASKPRHRIYMEIISALMVLILVIIYFVEAYTQVKAASKVY